MMILEPGNSSIEYSMTTLKKLTRTTAVGAVRGEIRELGGGGQRTDWEWSWGTYRRNEGALGNQNTFREDSWQIGEKR